MARVDRLAPAPSSGRGVARGAAAWRTVTGESLVRRLTRWLRRGRTGDAVVAAGTAAGLTGEPVRQGEAIMPFAASGRARRVLMAVVIGLDGDALERTLAAVSASSEHTDGLIAPLCLTDCPRFEPFRRRGLLFEYFPGPRDQARFAPDLDWDLYILRRLARLRRKWNPIRIVAFGQAAQAQVEAWRSSPFEDESIKTLMRSPQLPDGAEDQSPHIARD